MNQGGERTTEIIDLTSSEDVEDTLLRDTMETGNRNTIRRPVGHGQSVVIDLDAGEGDQNQTGNGPDIEFISERRINPTDNLLGRPQARIPRPPAQILSFGGMGPLHHNALLQLLRSQISHHNSFLSRTPQNVDRSSNFRVPPLISMNYAVQGFHLDQRVEAEPPRTSPELAPLETRAGFTRSPEEGDALICAACFDELCTGEDELKRQVWVIRSCGHAYCGRCAKIRSSSSAKSKGKQTLTNYNFTPPYPYCAVPACGQSTRSRSAMVQIFL